MVWTMKPRWLWPNQMTEMTDDLKRAVGAACKLNGGSGCLVTLPACFHMGAPCYCIVTAGHVIKSERDARRCSCVFRLFPDGDAMRVRLDPNRFFSRYHQKEHKALCDSWLDFCVCAVGEEDVHALQARGIQPIPITMEDLARQNMSVMCVQHPELTDRCKVIGEGHVLSVNAAKGLLQYDADTNAFSSGSPVFDKSTGRLVGVHSGPGHYGMNFGSLVPQMLRLMLAERVRGAWPAGVRPAWRFSAAPEGVQLSEDGTVCARVDAAHWTALITPPPALGDEIVLQLLPPHPNDISALTAAVGMAAADSDLVDTPGSQQNAVGLFSNGALWSCDSREPACRRADTPGRIKFSPNVSLRLQYSPARELTIHRRVPGGLELLERFPDVKPDWRFLAGGWKSGCVRVVRSEILRQDGQAAESHFAFNAALAAHNVCLSEPDAHGEPAMCRYTKRPVIATTDFWTAGIEPPPVGVGGRGLDHGAHPPPLLGVEDVVELEVEIVEVGAGVVGVGMGRHDLDGQTPYGAAVYSNGHVWIDGVRKSARAFRLAAGDRLMLRVAPTAGCRLHISREGLVHLKSFDVSEGWLWAVGGYQGGGFRIIPHTDEPPQVDAHTDEAPQVDAHTDEPPQVGAHTDEPPQVDHAAMALAMALVMTLVAGALVARRACR